MGFFFEIVESLHRLETCVSRARSSTWRSDWRGDAGKPWTNGEKLELVVTAYFDLLAAELRGQRGRVGHDGDARCSV